MDGRLLNTAAGFIAYPGLHVADGGQRITKLWALSDDVLNERRGDGSRGTVLRLQCGRVKQTEPAFTAGERRDV